MVEITGKHTIEGDSYILTLTTPQLMELYGALTNYIENFEDQIDEEKPVKEKT